MSLISPESSQIENNPVFVLKNFFNQYRQEWQTTPYFRTREELARDIRKNYPGINENDEISRTLAEKVNLLETVSPLSITDSIDLLKILDGDNFHILTTNLKNRLKRISQDSQEAKDIGIALGLLHRLDTMAENGELIPIFKPPQLLEDVYIKNKKLM